MLTDEQKVAIFESLTKPAYIDAMQLSRFAHIDWHIVSEYLYYLERIGILRYVPGKSTDGMTRYTIR